MFKCCFFSEKPQRIQDEILAQYPRKKADFLALLKDNTNLSSDVYAIIADYANEENNNPQLATLCIQLSCFDFNAVLNQKALSKSVQKYVAMSSPKINELQALLVHSGSQLKLLNKAIVILEQLKDKLIAIHVAHLEKKGQQIKNLIHISISSYFLKRKKPSVLPLH